MAQYGINSTSYVDVRLLSEETMTEEEKQQHTLGHNRLLLRSSPSILNFTDFVCKSKRLDRHKVTKSNSALPHCLFSVQSIFLLHSTVLKIVKSMLLPWLPCFGILSVRCFYNVVS
jgi:hypothetical protein